MSIATIRVSALCFCFNQNLPPILLGAPKALLLHARIGDERERGKEKRKVRERERRRYGIEFTTRLKSHAHSPAAFCTMSSSSFNVSFLNWMRMLGTLLW